MFNQDDFQIGTRVAIVFSRWMGWQPMYEQQIVGTVTDARAKMLSLITPKGRIQVRMCDILTMGAL